MESAWLKGDAFEQLTHRIPYQRFIAKNLVSKEIKLRLTERHVGQNNFIE